MKTLLFSLTILMASTLTHADNRLEMLNSQYGEGSVVEVKFLDYENVVCGYYEETGDFTASDVDKLCQFLTLGKAVKKECGWKSYVET